MARIGKVSYQVELLEQLAQVNNVFHVSQLRHYVVDPSHIIQIDPLEIQFQVGMTMEE